MRSLSLKFFKLLIFLSFILKPLIIKIFKRESSNQLVYALVLNILKKLILIYYKEANESLELKKRKYTNISGHGFKCLNVR